MRSPAAAIAWEFGRRHRWGWLAIAAYLIVLASVRLFFVQGQRVEFRDAQTFAFAVILPLTSAFLYFLAMFSFGLSGDLAGRQSMYPARMFTLPVTTGALAGWPMLYGTIAVAMLWLATRLLAVWPAGEAIPLLWPALLGPSLLAWTQALTWMPYPLPGLRVFVTVLWLAVVDAIVLVAVEFKVSEALMLAILAPHVPLAYVVARFAVGRARRGALECGGSPPLSKRPQAAALHKSAGHAQTWLEWRQHGRSLPAIVALLLPFELSLLFLFSETPVIVFEVIGLALITPPFMAIFVAATVSGPGTTSFLATRPMTDASLIAAKLKATIASALAAWLLVLIAIPAALRLSGTWPTAVDAAHRLVEIFGTPRAIAVALVALALLMLSTWKQLVQSLCIGMSGREWMVKGSVFAALAFLAVAFPLGHWILGQRVVIATLWHAMSWIAAALVCLKLIAAAWIIVRLQKKALLSDRALITGAALWSAAVFALYGLLIWFLPTMVFRHHFLALVAILAVPLARLSAAPLALAWSRHR